MFSRLSISYCMYWIFTNKNIISQIIYRTTYQYFEAMIIEKLIWKMCYFKLCHIWDRAIDSSISYSWWPRDQRRVQFPNKFNKSTLLARVMTAIKVEKIAETLVQYDDYFREVTSVNVERHLSSRDSFITNVSIARCTDDDRSRRSEKVSNVSTWRNISDSWKEVIIFSWSFVPVPISSTAFHSI